MQNLQGSAIVFLWLLFSGVGPQAPNPLPYIFINQPSFDFGEMRQGELYTHEFLIVNKGRGVLKIERIVSDDGFRMIKVDRSIPPEGNGRAIIQLEPSELHVGEIRKSIHLFTNDFQNPNVELELLGRFVSSKEGHASKQDVVFVGDE